MEYDCNDEEDRDVLTLVLLPAQIAEQENARTALLTRLAPKTKASEAITLTLYAPSDVKMCGFTAGGRITS